MRRIKIASFIFSLISVIHIVGIILKIARLSLISKPLILLSLIVLYGVSSNNKNKWYVLALIFSFFGDVFLMFEGELYFIIGLISFLLAHFVFIKIVLKRIEFTSIKRIYISSIPFVMFFILLIFTLKDSLNEMLVPVIVYGLTISAFGTISLINYRETKSRKSMAMLIGSILFMISDSILAINKFYEPSHYFEVIVMLTYILAQYFIYRSMFFERIKDDI